MGLRGLLALMLLLVFHVGVAGAEPVLVVDADSPGRIDLRAHMAVLPDPTAVLDETTAAARAAQFERLTPGRGLNFGYTDGALWLRLVLRSAQPEPSDWRLELDYASLDHAQLYDSGGPVQVSGDRVALAERTLPHRNPVFALTLVPGESRELLLRVRSEGSMTVNPSLWRAQEFQRHSEDSYAAHALFFGMLLALAAYNLLLYFTLRDRAYLYYVLFVLGVGTGIASIYGLAGQYLWPNAVDWSNRALVVGFALSGIVGPLFTREFLDTARRAPAWHRWLAIGAAVHVPVMVIGLWAPMRLGMQTMSVTTLLNCLLMLGCGIDCWRRRVPGARLFVLAWAVLLMGGVLMALRNFGLVPTNFLTLHGMQVGSALEMLLLSFALADRFDTMKREKAAAQAEALAAQRERVAALQEHERELENRVAERTAALAAANAQLRELALRDPLTGLANRAALYVHLDEALRRSRGRGQPICLLLVDLDGFKAVNDLYGHEAGDHLLVEVAERLRSVTRPDDLVARLGGDEFVLVAEALDLPRQAQRIGERLLSALAEPLRSVPQAQIGASVGIAVSAGENLEALLRRADAAMYAAKAAGRGNVQWADALP